MFDAIAPSLRPPEPRAQRRPGSALARARHRRAAAAARPMSCSTSARARQTWRWRRWRRPRRRGASSAWTSRARCSGSALAKTRRGRRGSTLLLAQGDATRLPLADGSADAATIAFGIRNVQQPDVGLPRACARPAARWAAGGAGVRPAGLAAVSCPVPVVCAAGAAGDRARGVTPSTARMRTCRSRWGSSRRPRNSASCCRPCGFPHVEVVPLTLGIVYLYVAQR